MAGVPCLNPAHVLLRGYERISMLNDLREAGLPIQSFSVALGERVLDLLHPQFPAVLKVGNFHSGFEGISKLTCWLYQRNRLSSFFFRSRQSRDK
jgi:hypothetical protein